LEKRFSKRKVTTFSKNFGGAWPLWPLPGYAYVESRTITRNSSTGNRYVCAAFMTF